MYKEAYEDTHTTKRLQRFRWGDGNVLFFIEMINNSVVRLICQYPFALGCPTHNFSRIYILKIKKNCERKH